MTHDYVPLLHLTLEHSFLILPWGTILAASETGPEFLGIVAAPRDFQGYTLEISNLLLPRKIKGPIFSPYTGDPFL